MINEASPTFFADEQPNKPWLTESDAQLRNYWRYYAARAHQFHKHGKISKAATLFSQCIQISDKLLHSPSKNDDRQSGIELFYFASHNLAACQNQLHQGTAAEHTLYTAYKTVIDLCENKQADNEVKLDALGILDKSLFSFISQLAYLGKVEPINAFIKKTDEFAEKMFSSLGNKY